MSLADWIKLVMAAPAGQERAGKRAAMVVSLLQSAKLNRHNPCAYIRDVLQRLPTHLNSRLEELLLHRWQPAAAGWVPCRYLGTTSNIVPPNAYPTLASIKRLKLGIDNFDSQRHHSVQIVLVLAHPLRQIIRHQSVG